MFLDVQRSSTDTSLSSEILRRFASRFKSEEWPGSRLPEVYYDPRSLEPEHFKRSSLHAKCIVVDREVAFVSSANLTEAAHVRNIEVGVLIRSRPFAQRLAVHFDSLVAAACLNPLPTW